MISTATDGNPSGEISTATEGFNDPDLVTAVGETVHPARRLEAARVSKHRRGRQPKKSASQKRRDARAFRARIQESLDAKALRDAGL